MCPVVKQSNGYGARVLHGLLGHGIGRVYHEDPQVLHYGEPGTGLELKKGMTFTVEPMVNAGKRHVQFGRRTEASASARLLRPD